MRHIFANINDDDAQSVSEYALILAVVLVGRQRSDRCTRFECEQVSDDIGQSSWQTPPLAKHRTCGPNIGMRMLNDRLALAISGSRQCTPPGISRIQRIGHKVDMCRLLLKLNRSSDCSDVC